MKTPSHRNGSMQTTRLITCMTLAAVLAIGCGTRDGELQGGGAASYNAIGQNTNENLGPELGAALPEEVNVRVISDKDSILTGSTEPATITAYITNDANGPVENTAVGISSDGGLLQNITAESDANGEAGATLALAKDFRNQEITIQVNANGSIGTAVVQATGTAIDFAGSLDLSIGSDAELTARLTSGVGEPIPNEPVIISSGVGHDITAESLNTDIDGVVEFTVLELTQSDTITMTALEGTVIGNADISVVTDLLTLSGIEEEQEIPVGQTTDVVVIWSSSGEPITGEYVRASLTAGQLLSSSEVRTNAAGEARFTLVSSSAGPATLTVGAADGSLETDVKVEFIATVPANLSIDSSSSRIPTLATSSITAIVTDANANPVKNQEVSFSSTNLYGGQLSPASAITNSDGEASVTFTAGGSATQFEELNIAAQIVGTSVSNNTKLTVVERVLNVTIGTSNEISERALGTQFGMPFVVQVADGGGAPLEGATVELSVKPLAYRKGYLELVDEDGMVESMVATDWSADRWVLQYVACASEDDNGNRILDAGEDNNNNGILDPQDPSLLAPVDDSAGFATLEGGTLVTDSRGTGLLELLYPASSALWARVEIVARAQALGAEAEATYQTSLPMLAVDANNTNATPPNLLSPYGTDLNCSNDN